MGAMTMVDMTTLTAGLKMFGSISDGQSDNHTSKMQSKYNISNLKMDNSIKNHNINLDILTTKREAEQIRTQNSYDMFQYDYQSHNTVASREVEILSSGVELSGSASAVLNGIENQVITERESRVQMQNSDALKREHLATNLLHEINLNNILTDYNIKAAEFGINNKISNNNADIFSSLGTSITDLYKDVNKLNTSTQKNSITNK